MKFYRFEREAIITEGLRYPPHRSHLHTFGSIVYANWQYRFYVLPAVANFKYVHICFSHIPEGRSKYLEFLHRVRR